MAVDKEKRLSQIARELNVGIQHLVDFLEKKGHSVVNHPNTKISVASYALLLGQFSSDKSVKAELEETRKKYQTLDKKREPRKADGSSRTEDDDDDDEEETVNIRVISETKTPKEDFSTHKEEKSGLKILGKIDLNPPSKVEVVKEETTEIIEHTDEQKHSESENHSSNLTTESIEEYHGETETEFVDDHKNEEVSDGNNNGDDNENNINIDEDVDDYEDDNYEDESRDNIQDDVAVNERSEESDLQNQTTHTKTETVIENPEVTTAETGGKIVTTEEQALRILGKIDLAALNQKVRPERKKTSAERRKERESREKASKDAIERAKLNRKNEEDARTIVKTDNVAKTDNVVKTDDPLKQEQNTDPNFIKTQFERLAGPVILGKIELKPEIKPDKDKKRADKKRDRKRTRIRKPLVQSGTDAPKSDKTLEKNKEKTVKPVVKKELIKKAPVEKRPVKVEVDGEDVNAQVKETLARLTTKGKKKAVKHRREKRKDIRKKMADEAELQELEESKLRVTEFVTANELATMMDVSVNEIIATCFDLGKMVTINSRMDAELISFIADEYGFEVEFISAADTQIMEEIQDLEEDLLPRAPIVTVMGHVDHGKTSLLDYIRHTNVMAGEAGGITQHIGAYSVMLNNQRITFLDTPGHEAFTAMRARGAKVTDVAIIIVAADDSIMPQTDEAINHAKAAGVSIIFAINKIDKPGANPEKIKEALAARNLLVEEWGGTYQSVDISAKKGLNIDKLLTEVLLAAEVLELKANPNRAAKGSVIEASLDRGRGYVSTLLVQNGTLKVGDVILAGAHSGKVKAMFNEKNERIAEAEPSMPVLVLGLDGAPQAGDLFHVMESEKDARDIAMKNKRLQREQTLRAHKHITLDEIGRRLKLGNFQRLNVIIKGDVIGSVEAIADSLIKLSTEEIELYVIHKGVGQISEADVMLATASDAIIVGFQVRPSTAARKLAEAEEIDIRLYSVIYNAIEEVKAAMEGMLSPEIREEIVSTVEIRTVFNITKVGNIAGCYVLDGKISRDDKVRVIRDGIVMHTSRLASLKRFKDDVKDVNRGYECGLNIHGFDDIKPGDIVESFKEVEFAKKLE